MSRSDTDADVINTNRPKFALGSEVSFVHAQFSGQVLIGRIASSRQIIRGGSYAMVQITYDIHASGMLFTDIPEENIMGQARPNRFFNRMAVK